ncbi:MAG: hypothetical protein R6V27_00875 [Balneolaceae bacterium]
MKALIIILYTLFINPLAVEAVAEDPCPIQNSLNQTVIEGFLTDTVWAAQRTESNTESLTVSQISVLDDTSESSVCSSFNDIYQEAFDEKNGLGEPANNVTYYKAGNFYFVVITPRQSDNTDYITFGTSYLHIYDQNIDLVKAYAF